MGQKFRYITYKDKDAPFIKVNQVIQDSHEYMWIATDQGLYRFDGRSFEDYNTSLRSRYIKSIIGWKKDTLLFSNDTGVFKLFYKEDRPEIVPFLQGNTREESLHYPGNLFKDTKDRLWIAQLDGSIFLKNEKKEPLFKLTLLQNQKTPNFYFAEDKFGTIWILLPQVGLYYFSESEKKLVKHTDFENVFHFYVENDTIWLIGNQISKLQVSPTQQVIHQEQVDNQGLYFYHISKDLAGTFFLASDQGIYTFQNDQKYTLKKVFGSNDPHRVEQLPYEAINHLYFSTDQIRPGGKVWISTSSGLGLLWSSFFQNVSGMSHDNVFSMSAGPNNEVFISQGNVNRITNIDGNVDYNQVTGINGVTAITTYENNVWYGTSDGKIMHYKDENIQTTYDLKDRGGGVFYMFADHMGEVWFCQAPTDQPIVGVAKIGNDGRLTLYDEANGLVNRILVVNEGGRSELYVAGIGKKSYLYKYNRVTNAFENKSLAFSFKVSGNFEVHDLAIDQNGIVWLGTTDGLLKYDTERVQRVDLGLFTKTEIRSVCVIPGGGLWLATDTNGLVHLDKEGNYAFFDEKSGTPSKVASYRSMIMDSSNHLWVGTAEGAVYSSQSKPKPLITNTPILNEVYVDDKPKEVNFKLSLPETSQIRLNFNSITYPGDDINYQYKIYDKNTFEDQIIEIQWSMPSEEDQITLQNLKGQKYDLLIRAEKPGGYSWSVPLKIDLEVNRKWYKTLWGNISILIIGIFGLWYFLRLWVFRKTKNLKTSLSIKQKELHEKEEALISQRRTLKHQIEELKNTGTNIYLLYRLLRQIPENSYWSEAILVLTKLVELPTGVDAFAIAFKKGEELWHRGRSREGIAISDRKEEFNEKESLSTYVLIGNKPILIGDFGTEAEQYISKKEDEGYLSRILVPFIQKQGNEAVFCIYGKEKNKFTQRDLTLIQILTAFLSITIIDELR
ncbi:hypothetical protein GCM10022258_20060 [Aquimarina gracilis]